MTFSQRLSALLKKFCLVNLIIENNKHKFFLIENLGYLTPDEEDDRKEVEHNQDGDEDCRLRSIIPRTLTPPNLSIDCLAFNW